MDGEPVKVSCARKAFSHIVFVALLLSILIGYSCLQRQPVFGLSDLRCDQRPYIQICVYGWDVEDKQTILYSTSLSNVTSTLGHQDSHHVTWGAERTEPLGPGP